MLPPPGTVEVVPVSKKIMLLRFAAAEWPRRDRKLCDNIPFPACRQCSEAGTWGIRPSC